MRNLKALGLALVAAFALTAVMASAASARTSVFTGFPFVHGVDDATGVTSLTGGAGVKCTDTPSPPAPVPVPGATYEGTAFESTLTVVPSFHNCKTATNAPVTVTANGCAYKLTLGGPLASDTAPVTNVELECPIGKEIEVHIYGNAAHTIPGCTISIERQIATPNNLNATDTTNKTVDIVGSVTGITSRLSGPCLTGPPFNLPFHGPIGNPSPLTLDIDILLRASAGAPFGLATQL